jgi:hypothetical protein
MVTTMSDLKGARLLFLPDEIRHGDLPYPCVVQEVVDGTDLRG